MVNVKRKPWDQLSTKQKALLVVIPTISSILALGLNTNSMIQAIAAHSALSTVASDVLSVIANMDSAPITDVTVATTCPSGYTSLQTGERITSTKSNEKDKIFSGKWPGAVQYCSCSLVSSSTCGSYNPASTSSDCFGVSSSNGTCSANQTNAGCVGVNSVSAMDLNKIPDKWSATQVTSSSSTVTGYNLCVQRASSPWKDYVVTNTSNCGSNEIVCGGFCYDGTSCPVQSFTLTETSGTGAPTVTLTRLSASSSGDATPLINIVVSVGLPCWGRDGSDGTTGTKQAVKARNNNQQISAGQICKTDRNSINDFPVSAFTDTRYSMIASFSQWSLYAANEIRNNGLTNLAGVSTADSVYNSFETTAGSTSASDVAVASAWGVYGRGGIFWKDTCAQSSTVSKDKVTDNADPIGTLVSLQTGLLVVQILFGFLIAGLFIPIITLMNIWRKDQDVPCIPGEGMEEKKRIGIVKGGLGVISNVIKLALMFSCFAVTSAIKAIFEDLKGKECSDSITNFSFDQLGDTITKVHAANVNGIVSDIISVVIILLGWAYAAYNKCKPDYAAMIDPPADKYSP